jgi:sugar lactone lactonase YvrE
MAARSVASAFVLSACLTFGASLFAQSGRGFLPPPDGSSAGALANSCGLPATPPPATGRGGQAVFPDGPYPVTLPAASLLGARNDLPHSFRPGVDWGQLPPGRKWGSTASITTAPDNTIWVADRCGNSGAGGTTCGGASATVNPIFQFDTSGKLLKTLGAGIFVSPHKLTVDSDGNLWLADNGANQVFKLDPNGKVLLTLGKKGVAGSGPDEFDAPTEVAVAPNGDIFVADGHGGKTNARIVKLAKDGKFIKTWGKEGKGQGEFNGPHGIAMDSTGRLFVADRLNSRIQIFDQDGKFLAEWKQFGRPSGVWIDKNDAIYVADSQSSDKTNPGFKQGIRVGNAKDGKVAAFIEESKYLGALEGVGADDDGNIYAGYTNAMNLQRFVKKESR